MTVNKFIIIIIIIIPLHWLSNLVLLYLLVCSFILDPHKYLCISNTEDACKI